MELAVATASLVFRGAESEHVHSRSVQVTVCELLMP